jgi:hypothetical protein
MSEYFTYLDATLDTLLERLDRLENRIANLGTPDTSAHARCDAFSSDRTIRGES